MAKSRTFILILFAALILSRTVYGGDTTKVSSKEGVSKAFPDKCKTPSPAGPVPIPYPNIGTSSDTAKGSKTVKIEGKEVKVKDSAFKASTGDEAGTSENSGADMPTLQTHTPADYPVSLQQKPATPADN